MRSIQQLKHLINSYGNVDRVGKRSIQHQTFFMRPSPLNKEDGVNENFSDFTDHQMESWATYPSFQRMIDHVEEAFVKNVAEPIAMVTVPSLVESYNEFLKESKINLPPIESFQMEIRDAQPFSQNLYYFIEQESSEEMEKFLQQTRASLAEHNLPGEMVNIDFNAAGTIAVNDVYRMLTFVTVLLKESAKTLCFLPGRAIGVFKYITE